ncbi:mammalian uncoordinated homology 13 protein [Tanacetum coccineum]
MMVRTHREYFEDPINHIHVPSPRAPHPVNDLSFPFRDIDGLDHDDLRMTAYEIFFTACRPSSSLGRSTSVVTFYPYGNGENRSRSPGSPGSPRSPRNGGSPRSPRNGVGMMVTSRTKKALGLKMLKRTSSTRRTNSCGSNPLSPGRYYNNGNSTSPRAPFSTLSTNGRTRRPLTSAEIMRQQMKVSDGIDNRLRKTLMRTLVGQTGRRANTIILPLELFRQLKLTEFEDANEYHVWQKRQLKILEAGLLTHPFIPLDKTNTFAKCLRDIIRDSEVKLIDTNKNSQTMKNLCNSVFSLSWRSSNGAPTDVCHWADGYPLNVILYVALLRSIFDLKDETCVLDEVDELLELMKKTWPILGISRPIHNLCFTWVLFEQYVMTGQVENDLLSASLTMLTEVSVDSKKVDKDPIYVDFLSVMLNSMKTWSENRLLDYHDSFSKGTLGLMENILPLVFSATKILEEDVLAYTVTDIEKYDTGNKVDYYIRSSLSNAFAKMLENDMISESMALQEESERLIRLAKGTGELALREKAMFSTLLKKWHPISAGVAAVTLHACYGNLLRQFLAANSMISNETIAVLQRADKLEKVLVNMVVEDTLEYEDGGKTVVREMVPYEVDSVLLRYLRQYIQESLKRAKDVVHTAKDTETWNPKSKSEPYAQSALDLIQETKVAIDSYFDIPIGVSQDLVREFAYAVEDILHDYTNFVASCGSKQSYVPTLPPLTRCGRNSKFIKLWKLAAPAACAPVISTNPNEVNIEEGANCSRPSTSRGTQRLYIRLNTLHYILSQLHSLQKSLTVSPRILFSPKNRLGSYFDQTRHIIQSATQHVSEVSAYRLIFLDSNSVFYNSLYVADVENARIAPALKIMKHNLTLLTAILTDRAQPLATKELMKASFDVFLMVLLAGGSSRNFTRLDHSMIEDDFKDLKKLFSTHGDGLIVEDVVDREAENVEGVVSLMGRTTEQLVDDLGTLVYDENGVGVVPTTTGKWSSTDQNTILRVLCYRNESGANLFLKRTFQLAKRG